MDTKPINPLIKHFRQPSIYLKLPSKGQFWKEDSLDLPVTGEIPVYPMTAADEITLKTPDALMNGTGVVNVIQSCVPSIKNAWDMPSVDVDATLIAIRIASYGNLMGVTAKCPHCGEEHDYDVDLTNLLDQVVPPDYTKLLDFDGLKIKLHPQKYFNVTQTNITQFEEQKMIQTLNDDSIPTDVKSAKIKESMDTILRLNEKLLVTSTQYIETEDAVQVKNPEFLEEFYRNADSKVVKIIETRLEEIAKEGAMPPFKLQCTSCSGTYEVPLEFDYSRFFASGS
jgi:hypothetical protein